MIDSHAHLTSSELFENLPAILERAQTAGLKAIVNICTDGDSLKRGIELAKSYPWVHNAASTTPHDAEKEGDTLFPIMEAAAREGHLVAVGETGLDYFHYEATKEAQKKLFCRYLALALSCKLPVIIHCREAFRDFFEIIDSDYKGAPGVLHCFTGTREEAIQLLDRGWTISLSGIVTFKKSQPLQEVAKLIPLNQLFIETDAPYLAPQGHRGKLNEPAFLTETAAFIAALKGLSPEALIEATSRNARTFFKL